MIDCCGFFVELWVILKPPFSCCIGVCPPCAFQGWTSLARRRASLLGVIRPTDSTLAFDWLT